MPSAARHGTAADTGGGAPLRVPAGVIAESFAVRVAAAKSVRVVRREGTPPGVGMARTPPIWLKHGDLVEVEIQGIGAIKNRVRCE